MLITLTIVALLAANGFFVAAEFALVKARRMRLQAMAAEGRFGAVRAEMMRANVEPYLAACQLGITMASLGLGWVGEPAVAHLLEPVFAALEMPVATVHTVSFLIGFVVFSSLHIVVGEQVPKTWAIRVAEPMACGCAWPLQLWYWFAWPLNWLLNGATASVLSLFGIAPSGHGDVYTDRELLGMIEASSEHGAIDANKAAMLSNMFAFDERSVSRVMIPHTDVDVLTLGASDEVNRRALRTGHSRFPLIDPGMAAPVGVVLAKSIYLHMLDTGTIDFSNLQEIALEPVVVPETLKVATLFETMRSQRVHMAIVVDEYGQFVGVVTLEDLLEEIVGEIHDEFDEADVPYAIHADGDRWLAHGLTPLGDVERAVGLAVPDSLSANTLSGLLMQRLGRMPQVGDSIEEGAFILTVTAVDQHRVSEVELRPAQSPEAGAGDAAPVEGVAQ